MATNGWMRSNHWAIIRLHGAIQVQRRVLQPVPPVWGQRTPWSFVRREGVTARRLTQEIAEGAVPVGDDAIDVEPGSRHAVLANRRNEAATRARKLAPCRRRIARGQQSTAGRRALIDRAFSSAASVPPTVTNGVV